MKYQVLERIFNQPSFPRKFERLELDHNFQILDNSEQVHKFAERPEEVIQGKDIRLSFPEFIGMEDILVSILKGEQELFELPGIRRCVDNNYEIYIDIYVISEQVDFKSANRLLILIEEVTDRLAFEQKLAQKYHEASLLSSTLIAYKNYMEQVIGSMADALLVTSNSGKIKKINTATKKIFGFTEAELIGKSISLIIDDYALFQNVIKKYSLSHHKSSNIEVVCRTKKREKLLIAFSCSVFPNHISSLEDIVYIGRDITARQRREQRICAQYAITRILSESQSIKEAMPKILQAICQTIGWDLGELWTPNQYISRSIKRHSNHDIVLRCIEIWSSRVVSVREFKAITWQTTYKTGVGLPGRIWARRSPIWIKDIADDDDLLRSQPAAKSGLHAAFGFPIVDDHEILGVMVFFNKEVLQKDIDFLQMMVSIGNQIGHFIKCKQTEAALVESEERYRDLFENVTDLIQSVNAYGRFLYVNKAWQKTLGYSESEIANLTLFDIIHPDFHQRSRQKFYSVMSGEKLAQVQTAFVTKNGQTIFLEGNINCKFVEGKAVAIRGIFRNITQRILAQEALYNQKEQTERLLSNISPVDIAIPRPETGVISKDFVEVTVLFADIIGLSEIATSMSAMQLVSLLNPIFSAFDSLSERYSLQKIQGINDAYIVIAGLPMQRTDHAQAIAHMALDMQTAIALFNSEHHQNFNIRIGIHTGPLIVSMMQVQKFDYHRWGETVQLSSCMELQGIPGQIQVSQITYERLYNDFFLEKRGEIEIVGKGFMSAYLLLGRK
ncbi:MULTISPECIES: adenylate/guanylate cyclase domain-containing protein [unclassified Tolypothrix]|uniref:adenylate/guanylate cyclase domain-containing protein n=1 Tax=unclassified Tolypothrix TaxID=2649714 RepID=UPI0005EAC2CA|nr:MULTISPECIES: adenylate/guanylate cyclase domain-containing protein [unclassified Tolypothrix]BAY94167.1 adenylate/guanylate cyclase [Microchaete diplosiphon NIES-3275]EKF03765.1 PAS domain S-box [Tolypothrix sp. PCC 7601]MBE9084348.1 PAS domain S-box protein [Tolypothrix sp. LEGE 11397]UYD27918.1 PAS domain S-box protein [Tolypothrix sp. PCC 7712]UYD36214.1 PAS domain S-box protein [Tolypothrix sp. PCC 7601]